MILAGLFKPLASTVGVAAVQAAGQKRTITPAAQAQVSAMFPGLSFFSIARIVGRLLGNNNSFLL